MRRISSSQSFLLIENVKQGTWRYFHRNWCPEELGFMLEMKFPSCPLGLIMIWGSCSENWKLSPVPGSAPSRSKHARPIHLPIHVTYSPASSKVSQLLQQGKLGLSFFSFPSLKQDSCLVSKTSIWTVIPGDCLQLGHPMKASSQLGMCLKNVVQRCCCVNEQILNSG